MEEYKEVKKELNKSHKDLGKFVINNVCQSRHKMFYKLLNEVITNEVEIEKFCNN